MIATLLQNIPSSYVSITYRKPEGKIPQGKPDRKWWITSKWVIER
jgi:hypothetical protein